LADYFGLPRDFDSRIKFCPEIQNVVVDLNLWLGLDEAAEGLYLKINAPIVWTKWQLCPSERVVAAGETDHRAGYMSEEEIAREKMPTRFLQYMAGGVKVGDMSQGLNYGRIDNCACTKTRLGEIDLTLGWNFVLEEDYHFGGFLYVAAPAGNRPCGTRLFEPMVGNGKHWEFGGGFTGSWIFWRDCECDDRYMGLWFDATVAHLFKACQCRSFDFCNKPNSRYMLLEEMTSDNTDVIEDGEDNAANYVYKKNLIPAANWSTFNVDVKIDIQADIALKLAYTRCNWNFDLGYNLWARTGEKFCLDNCACNDSKYYAIKGDAQVYGENAEENKFALSATQSEANIYAGKNYPAQTGDLLNPEQNVRIDNPKAAYANGSALNTIGTSDEINTSIQPVLVSRNLLNLGKSPSAITHKLFANISYAWTDRECDDYVPFLGIGGKVEFAQDDCCNDCCDDKCCDTNCTTNCTTSGTCTCNNTPCTCGCGNYCNDNCCSTRRGGLSQWGIWIKGGVAFD